MESEKRTFRNHKATMHNYVRKFDEYYTQYAHVKDIFDNYIPHNSLKDKKIYCPCDSPESNFVIYLKEHKDDLGYKELIYTWDDYNTHIDLFEECDIVITNPPFSKLIREFIPILNKVKKEFFILGSLITTGHYYNHFEDRDNIKFVREGRHFNFILPEGCELKNNPEYIYMSNLDINNYFEDLRYRCAQKIDAYGIYKDGKKYKNYDYLRNVPLDEYDEILVPSTVILEHNRKFFDIIGELGHLQYTDNKSRFKRYLVKRKKLEQQP